MPVATTTALLIGGAAIAGGAAASSMGSGGGKVKAPAAQSPEELGRDSLEAQIALAPDVYRTEAQYRPLYAALDSNILNDTLFGGTVQQPGQFSSSAYIEQNPAVRTAWEQATATRDARGRPIQPQTTQSLEQFAQAHWEQNGRVGGLTPGQSVQTPGLLDMIGRSGTVLGQQQIDANRMQRTADIADVAALGGQAQAAYRAANPQLTNLMDQMAARAMNPSGSSASGMQQQGPRQMPAQAPSAPSTALPGSQFGAGINAPQTGPFPSAAPQQVAPGAQGPMVAPQMRDERAIPAQQVGPGGGLTAPVAVATNMQASQIGLADQLTAPQASAERLGPLGQLSAPQIGLAEQLTAPQVSAERLGPLGELQATQINTRTQSGLLDGLNSAAQADLGLGGALNSAQNRMAQQSVRSAMGARGLNASTPAMFAEGLAALDYGRGLQNERRAFASNVEQMNQGASAQTLARDQFNAGNQMQAGQFNLAQALQAGMANQNATNAMAQFNAGNQMQAGQFNIGNQLDVARFNAGNEMQAGQFNLSQALQAGVANQNATNAMAQFNAGNQMQAGQFNIGNQLDVARFNAGNEMQAGMANQNAANTMAQFNAGNQMQAGQFNLAQAMQAQLANQAAGNQMAQFNQANAMDRERFNIANDIEAQRFNLGFGMQQQESDRAYQMNVANMLAAQAQDPFQMVLGRSAVPGAGMAVAQNNLGRTSLPQMFNPWDSSIMGIYSGNQANQLAAATATANNRAAQNGAMMGMLGTLGGAAIMACWVARECYGEHNPTWMRFRTWLMERAPARRRAAYLARGPHIARWLSTRPDWAARVRRWMDGVLAADDLLQLATA